MFSHDLSMICIEKILKNCRKFFFFNSVATAFFEVILSELSCLKKKLLKGLYTLRMDLNITFGRKIFPILGMILLTINSKLQSKSQWPRELRRPARR